MNKSFAIMSLFAMALMSQNDYPIMVCEPKPKPKNFLTKKSSLRSYFGILHIKN